MKSQNEHRVEERRQEKERVRREMLRQQEKERLRREMLRKQEEERVRREMLRQQEKERLRREMLRQQEKERLRREMLRQQEEERVRREMLRQQEEERVRREMLRQQEEERVRSEMLRQQEEERLRREMLRQQEEERVRSEMLRQQEEERLRREKKRRQEEERCRREKERQQKEERQRTIDLNGEIKKTLQSAKEKVSMQDKAEKREVVKNFYNHFQTSPKKNVSTLIEILSSRCNILSEFDLSQLSSVQLEKVINVVQDLLFDEWVNQLPSFETLKHAQVLLTELCILFRPESRGIFMASTSDDIHHMVDEICHSEDDMYQCFLLTQALFLTLMELFVDAKDLDLKALYIAEKWSGGHFSTEETFTVRFLETLLVSLQKAVEGVFEVAILDMEKKCFRLLLSVLESVNKKATGSIKILLKLMDVTQWTPSEAIGLFKILTEKYDNDTEIYNILQLVQLNHFLPSWKDESGQSLFELLYLVDSESFYQILQNTMKSQNEHRVDEILNDIQSSTKTENADIIKIKQIVISVLKSIGDDQAENKTREHLLLLPLRRKKLRINDLELALYYMCKEVFYTKGWWPSLSQMIHWCLLMLNEESETLEIVGFDVDPCVTAMFLVMQVIMGSKVHVVLSSAIECNQQMHEWSDVYKHFGISCRLIKGDNDSGFVSDIAFSTMDEYIAHYLQYCLGLQKDEHKQLTRRFVVDKKCLVLKKSFFSKSSDNVALKNIQICLENLMKRFFLQEKYVEQSDVFIRAIFQALHTMVEDMPDANGKILTILQNLTKHKFTSEEETILKFLDAMTKHILASDDINILPDAEEDCSDYLLTTAMQLCSDNTVTELIRNLLAGQLWTSVQVLKLLETLLGCRFRDGNLSIMKLIHLLTIYQISPEWKNKNDQTVLQILCSTHKKTEIKDLEKQFKNEGPKSIDAIFKELRELKEIDEATINMAYSVVKHVQELILSGVKMKFALSKIRELSISREVKDLQEVLSALCYTVHRKMGWWPRLNQLISWCVFALSESGTLLEIGTGEGKSCVIAMYAALRVLRGGKVDIISSSSVLCQRDSKEWSHFYKELGITVGTNTGNEDQKECYQNDIIYGTVDAFAGDYLRQIFEMRDTRLNREFQCVIIDEVDSLLLDNGVQLTYLSDDISGIQHLNPVLSFIWGHVNQYGLVQTESETAVHGPIVPFHKAVYDAIDTEGSEISGPLDILQIAEDKQIVPQGFVKELSESKDNQYLDKLKTINKDSMISFFVDIVKDYIPYNFVVYKQNENGFLQLINPRQTSSEHIQELSFLILDKGLCCALYSSEESLHNPIATMIQEKLKFTPCEKKEDGKISIPGFLKNLVDNKLITWIQNAFLALKLKQGREYIVDNERICPVDFRSTGIVELNKKWGDGLQQFLEMKHRVKLSSLTVVTNYISNITFFRMYQGRIYGTTGTLGNQDEIQLLQDLYPKLSASRMPSFTREKLFEIEGIVTSSHKEWKAEICNVVKDQGFRNGRAALVICETINKANELHEELQGQISGEIILYSHSDKDCKISKPLEPGDVIVATNLAGRGTDIKISDEVTNNGGLFVILSFLAENLRIERQAFGRAARKGNPGSAKIITCTDHLEGSLKEACILHDAKLKRDILSNEKMEYMKIDLQEVYLQENLFFEYCKIMKYIHENANDQDRMTLVGIMNEYWGIWLQTKAKEIEQLKTDELLKSLTEDMEKAKDKCLKEESPISSIYHYVKLGNNELLDRRWEEGLVLYERAMRLDPSWAAIAFYNHAYCTLLKGSTDCITTAINDLSKSLESLKNYFEACAACQYVLNLSQSYMEDGASESLNKQFIIKINVLCFFQKNIEEAIEKLKEIESNKGKAQAIQRPIFQLVSHGPDDLTEELCLLKSQGLHSVFSVQEKPHFSWGGLAVFFIGLAQMVAGSFLIALTCGVLATVGKELIMEGISDCIYGVEAILTGSFSWKDWAIQKAISVAVSLIGFGVGKFLAKGFKACKRAVTGVGKELKVLRKSVNQMSHTVVKRNMINAAKCVAKTAAEQTALTLLSKCEDLIFQKIMNSIEEKIKEELARKIEEDIMKGTLSLPTDVIILSHLKESRDVRNLVKEDYIKNNMMSIFTECSTRVLNSDKVTWQSQLVRSVIDVINKAKDQLPKSKIKWLLTKVQVAFMTSRLGYCSVAVGKLLNEFSNKYNEELKTLIEKEKLEKKIDCEDCDLQYLHAFKKELAGVIAAELKTILLETIHDSVLSHVKYIAQQKINGQLMKPLTKILQSNKTLELVKAGQKHNFIVNHPLSDTGEIIHHDFIRLQSYAEKVKKSETPGTILSLRILAEKTRTRVVVLTENNGKLNKMLVLDPSSKPASRTIELIYKPKSEQYPNGHYNAWINNREVTVVNTDNSCMYYAFARSINPGGSDEEISSRAKNLRLSEAKNLVRHPKKWIPLLKSKEQLERIRGGDWFLAEGQMRSEETRDLLQEQTGKVGTYQELRIQNRGMGHFINADHQPPLICIVDAARNNQNSELAKGFLKVGVKQKELQIHSILNITANQRSAPKQAWLRSHTLGLLCVNVPKKVHNEFPSTRSPKCRKLIRNAIENDQVTDAFKYTILGTIPRCGYNSTRGFIKSFGESGQVYEQSFQEHTKKWVNGWFSKLKETSARSLITDKDHRAMLRWIETKQYENKNDPHWKNVAACF